MTNKKQQKDEWTEAGTESFDNVDQLASNDETPEYKVECLKNDKLPVTVYSWANQKESLHEHGKW